MVSQRWVRDTVTKGRRRYANKRSSVVHSLWGRELNKLARPSTGLRERVESAGRRCVQIANSVA
eukprot:7168631-Prymnesium_polylepis.1